MASIPSMSPAELSDILREIGWPAAELQRRLGVREETIRQWLNGRRTIPPNLEQWLYAVRDNLANAPPLPDGWRSGGC
jgi:DNA-binding transcriptional regulator YiaG